MNRKGTEVTGIRLLDNESEIYHATHTKGNRLYLCDCSRFFKVIKDPGYRHKAHKHKRNQEL